MKICVFLLLSRQELAHCPSFAKWLWRTVNKYDCLSHTVQEKPALITTSDVWISWGVWGGVSTGREEFLFHLWWLNFNRISLKILRNVKELFFFIYCAFHVFCFGFFFVVVFFNFTFIVGTITDVPILPPLPIHVLLWLGVSSDASNL